MIKFVLLTRITLDNNSLVATTGYNSNLCYQTRSCPKLGGTVKWCIVIFLCQFCHKDHGQNFKQLLAPCQTPRNIFDFSINSAKRTETNLGHKLFDGDSRWKVPCWGGHGTGLGWSPCPYQIVESEKVLSGMIFQSQLWLLLSLSF